MDGYFFRPNFLGTKLKRKKKNISKLISSLSGLLRPGSAQDFVTRIHFLQKRTTNFIKEHRTVKILHLFRSYSALFVVMASCILVSATNLAAGKESSGFLFGYLDSEESGKTTTAHIPNEPNNNRNLAMAPLSQPKNSLDPEAELVEEEELVTMKGQALVAGISPVRKDPVEDGGVEKYEVKEGDTVSTIAAKFNVSSNTILWANSIDDIDSIKPGDVLFILPVSGLTYTVKKGDNIDSIATKYKASRDKIIEFNELPANGELTEGETITIPGGQKEETRVATSTGQSSLSIATRQYETFTPTGKTPVGKAGTGHRFPYGYCTWYVAQKRYVPWGGNAGTWLYNAKSMGYATGKTPRVGSIMVSSESWWGHVAVVEKVSGDMITISEMNYKGWAKKSYRTLSYKSRQIKGFIY